MPECVRELAAGRPVQAVWKNELGGLTFRIGDGEAPRFVKWAPAGSGVDLSVEAVRLRWAADFTTVPHVLDEGSDAAGSWMVTAELRGSSAVDDRWKREPEIAVRAVGSALRRMHEQLPVGDCPFDWSAGGRLETARTRAAFGHIDMAECHADFRHLGTAERALELLAAPPPADGLVVCHGDACAPNTLIGDDGECSGHVDLGALGVADRWADLAVATWSTQWNYGPGWEEPLLDAYGIEADPERITYYRLLWELSD
ncbi:aminoglycoside phosphotransferase [Streptomyces nanshensis]|uniref:Aminoglycoside phosphotransferase n=1 Tax=Streptomyces nanshensis TaxID=518642 RepID=A0A1E7KWY1_9ACTN|nr:aminoglycoside phosphotransferase [Streptomyces nanshensis]